MSSTRSHAAGGGSVRRFAAGLLAAGMLAGACTSSGSGSTASSGSPTASGTGSTVSSTETTTAGGSSPSDDSSGTPSPGATVQRVVVSVANGKVTPPPGRVNIPLGSVIQLQVTSDRPDELHVHGFGDQERELTAGVPVTLTLPATEPGVFEVELHEADLLLLQLQVR